MAKLCLSFMLCLLCALGLQSQVCDLEITGPIFDNSTTVFPLIVEGAINNDLSTGQGVCLVELEFEHEFIADITIELVSPSGQIVQLVGPGVLNSSFTSNINWNVDFASCAAPAVPDIGFSQTWNNLQNWGIGSAFDGSYYPNVGCLEDFNTGPVNGAWTLRISDVSFFGAGELLGFTIHFCDPLGITCQDCEPDAGDLVPADLILCESAPDLDLNWNPTYTGNQPDPLVYDYLYVVSSNNVIVDYLNTPDLVNFPPADYLICGLSLLSNQILNLPAVGADVDLLQTQIDAGYLCADLNPDCTQLLIQDIPDTLFFSQQLCKNDTFKIHGLEFFEDGIYNFVNQNNLCDSAFVLEMNVIEHTAFIEDHGAELNCTTPAIELDGSLSFTDGAHSFSWYTTNGNIDSDPNEETIIVTQPGEYFLVIEGSGCADTSSIVIGASSDFPAITLTGDPLDCATSTSFIELETTGINPEFNWDGPGFTSIEEDVSINSSGLYEVTVTSVTGCSSYSSIFIEEANNVIDPEFFAQAINCEFAERQIQFITNTTGNTYQWSGPNGFDSTSVNPIVNTVGNYEVTVTSSTLCFEIYQLEVVDDFQLYNLSVELDTINCLNPSVELTVSSQDANATFEWIDKNLTSYTGSSITTDVEGNYTISVLQENGCVKDTIIELIMDIDVPTITTSNEILDCGVDSIQLFPVYGVSVDQIIWTGPNGFMSNESNPWIEEIGKYYVTVISDNYCEKLDSVQVIDGLGVPNLNVQVDTITCINSSVQFQVNLNAGYSFAWDGPNMFDSTIFNPSTSDGGSYSVTVTDDITFCTASSVITVVVDTLKPSPTLIGSDITCSNTNPMVDFESTESLLSWEWTSPMGVTSNDTTFVVNGVGWYVWEGVGGNGCVSTDSIEVIIDDQVPSVETRDTFINCISNEVVLPLDIFDNYSEVNWTGPGFTSQMDNPSVDMEGKYYVEIIGENGCITYDSLIVISDRLPPQINLDLSNNLTCVNNTATITSMSPDVIIDYAWIGPNSQMLSTQNITISQPGWYYLTVTGMNSCTTIDSIEVLLLDVLPDVEATATIINCKDLISNVEVLHQEINPTFLWDGPNNFTSDMESFQVSEPGKYFVTITDSQGCSGIDSVMVMVDTLFSIKTLSVSDTLNCNITDVMVSVNVQGDDSLYLWTSPSNLTFNTPTIIVDEPGIYSLSLTVQNHCISEWSTEVFVDTSKSNLTLEASDINCVESKVTLEVTSDGPIVNVEWTGPQNFSSIENPTLTFTTGWHYAEVVSENGCSTIDSILVEENYSIPDLIVDDLFFECEVDSAQLLVQTTQMNINYQWFGPSNFYSEEPAPFVFDEGQYILVSSFSNGCLRFDTLQLTEYPEVPAFQAFGGEITCSELSIELSTDIVNYLSLEWTGPNGFISNIPNPMVSETGIYDLEVITAGNCVYMAQTMVTVDTIYPNANIDQNAFLLCDIVEVNLDASLSETGPDLIFNWTTDVGNFISDENTLNPLVSGEGTYSLTVNNVKNGCSSTANIALEQGVSDLQNLQLNVEQPTCLDDNDGIIEINGVNGGISPYSYSFNQSDYGNILNYENLITGEYLLSVKDSAGCIVDELIKIEDGFNLQIMLGADTTLFLGESLEIIPDLNDDPSNLTSIEWNSINPIECLNCFENTLIPPISALYEIYVENDLGCISSDAINITIDQNIPIYIPNVFSPDNDGFNDAFFIRDNGGIKEIKSFNIFDRWGNKVYSNKNFPSNDEFYSWDGKLSGEYVIPGVYVYLVEYELINGSLNKKSGNITIFK